MAIQVVHTGASQDRLSAFADAVQMLYIRLDMYDRSAIADAKRVVSSLKRSMKSKKLSEEDREKTKELCDLFQAKIKEIEE